MVDAFDIVVAVDQNRCIGKDGKLPWQLPGDMKYFRELTSRADNEKERNAVIMGRKTWESIPDRFRPLKNRINVVLTRQENYNLPEGVLKAGSIDRALNKLAEFAVSHCFIIGGGQIYDQAIKHDSCKHLYLTEIQADFDCDTFFPEYKDTFQLKSVSDTHRENGLNYCFKVFEKQNPDRLRHS